MLISHCHSHARHHLDGISPLKMSKNNNSPVGKLVMASTWYFVCCSHSFLDRCVIANHTLPAYFVSSLIFPQITSGLLFCMHNISQTWEVLKGETQRSCVVCPLMEGESFLKWVRIWGKQSEKRRRFGQIAQINQVPPKTVVTPSSTWFFWDLEMGPKVRSWYIKTLTFKLSKGSHRLTRPSRWFCNNFPKSNLCSGVWYGPIDPLMTHWWPADALTLSPFHSCLVVYPTWADGGLFSFCLMFPPVDFLWTGRTQRACYCQQEKVFLETIFLWSRWCMAGLLTHPWMGSQCRYRDKIPHPHTTSLT